MQSSNRDVDLETGNVDVVGGRDRWDELGDWDLNVYTTMHEINSLWGVAVSSREPSSALCGDLDGRDGGWVEAAQEGGDIYTYS